LKNIKFNTEFTIYASKEALKEDVQELFKAAETARKNAYAPYSKFLVGAALKLENGEVITGSNQENAAYPSGLCAERTAIFYAGAQFPNQKILKMAIRRDYKKKHSTVRFLHVGPVGKCL
jgi:cytidine deaminase